MGFAKGWNRGLSDGLEGSGVFVGFILPVTVAIILVVGMILLAVWGYGCVHKPGTCTNYTYSMGILGADEAKCTRWAAMDMRIEKRYVKGDLVHCRCTEGSFPKAK